MKTGQTAAEIKEEYLLIFNKKRKKQAPIVAPGEVEITIESAIEFLNDKGYKCTEKDAEKEPIDIDEAIELLTYEGYIIVKSNNQKEIMELEDLFQKHMPTIEQQNRLFLN